MVAFVIESLFLKVSYNLNRIITVLPWYSGTLADSRYNSSSTEARDLVATTGHGPTPPEEVTTFPSRRSTFTGGRLLDIHNYYTPGKSEIPLTYPAASHPRTRVPPGGIKF
ncbi:hypothetical protein AVEN_93663-1 [Araneus ventricosus]|uniref:Uncharacterized protein n=1 Tax=Araneus ventricosus TaxID=182803 RepID=A0A4Y2J946_ARAVE|nr:hypothetical protein AVEN_93663-1 [Araneus ventricosus]